MQLRGRGINKVLGPKIEFFTVTWTLPRVLTASGEVAADESPTPHFAGCRSARLNLEIWPGTGCPGQSNAPAVPMPVAPGGPSSPTPKDRLRRTSRSRSVPTTRGTPQCAGHRRRSWHSGCMPQRFWIRRGMVQLLLVFLRAVIGRPIVGKNGSGQRGHIA